MSISREHDDIGILRFAHNAFSGHILSNLETIWRFLKLVHLGLVFQMHDVFNLFYGR